MKEDKLCAVHYGKAVDQKHIQNIATGDPIV